MAYYILTTELVLTNASTDYSYFDEAMHEVGFERTILDDQAQQRYLLPKGTYFLDDERGLDRKRYQSAEEAYMAVKGAIEVATASNSRYVTEGPQQPRFFVAMIDNLNIHQASTFWSLQPV